MSDDPLDDLIRQRAKDYNQPPETPRERIWARIQAQRENERARRSWRRVFTLPRIWIPAAAAALLFAGIFIGRNWQAGPAPGAVSQSAPSADAEAVPQNGAASGESSMFKYAALSHFNRVDVMLTSFQTDTEAGAKPEMVDWAKSLLCQTRLLLDSPAAENAETDRLLHDLEFILAQIVQTEEKHNGSDRQWIEEGLNQKNILARLRTAVPAGDIRRGI